MLDIALTTVPFFGLVLCGWIAARTRRLPERSVAPLNGFVLWFALPAQLFRFVSDTPVDAILEPRIALSYVGGGLLAYAVAAVLMRRQFGSNWIDTGYGALAAAWPNWGYMGFGLLPALFGKDGVAIMISAGVMYLLVLMPFALLVASRAQSGGGMAAFFGGLASVARNPLFIAIAAGLATSLLQLKLPRPVDEFLRLLGSSAGPVALFAIGVFVYRPGPARADTASWVLIVIKLIVHPLLMWGVTTHVFGLPPTTAGVMTVVAALPAAGTAFIFIERNGGDVDRVANAILLSTALSFVTVTALVSWLRAGG